MKTTLLLLNTLCMLFLVPSFANSLRVEKLRCEYEINPIGISSRIPRLSWIIESEQKGAYQTAYQIIISSTLEKLLKNEGDIWNTGKVTSGQSNQIIYDGKFLESQKKYFWRVKVWNHKDEASAWSQPSWWTTGLLDPQDWKAQWIGWHPGERKKDEYHSVRVFKSFSLGQSPSEAVAYINTPGYYELYINDKKVGQDVLSPSVIDVGKGNSFYVTYDVSAYLQKGENLMEILLGRGWNKSDTARVRFQCRIKSGENSIDIVTDPTWLAALTPYSTIGKWEWNNFGGERYNALLENNAKASHAFVLKDLTGETRTQTSPLNRTGKPILPVKVTELGNHLFEFDFGTNLTGWMKLKIKKLNPGDTITIYYADKKFTELNKVIAPTGISNFAGFITKLPGEKDSLGYSIYNQYDQFISAGLANETFCSKFNYHGFRYAIVKGLAADPLMSDAEAMHIETDLEQVGSFECSNELLNRIHKVNTWTIRNLNLGGYMVDCPTRERMGYGDGQVSIESAIMNFYMPTFYAKWVKDWQDAQNLSTGALPNVAPAIGEGGGGPGWGGTMAAVIWRTYLYYGDKQILKNGYEPMRRYIDFLESKCTDGILHAYGGQWDFLGDWVAPGRGMDSNNWPPKEAAELFNNCYRLYLWQILEKSAEALGLISEVSRCRAKLEELRPIIHQAFYNPEQRIYVLEEQAYQVMPLMTGVVPTDLIPEITDRLVKGITVKNKGHLDTGMLGTYFLIQYLQNIGRDDLMYAIANQETFPSWGYMLSKGATTWWEQWNGYWSQIHACYTSLDGWFYQGLAGIRPDPEEPGFKKIIIKPFVSEDLTWVKASYTSIFGQIVSNWKKEKEILNIDIQIPFNSTAIVYFPVDQPNRIFSGEQPLEMASGLKFLRAENGSLLYTVQSGNYHFIIKNTN